MGRLGLVGVGVDGRRPRRRRGFGVGLLASLRLRLLGVNPLSLESLGEAFQPRLLCAPVLDFGAASIYEPLALEPSVEEGAFANTDSRFAMRSVSRAIACVASAAESAATSTWRFAAKRVRTVAVAVGGGPDQNLRSAGDDVSVRLSPATAPQDRSWH